MMTSRSQLNPTQRFSNRVENYIKYRPGYPVGVIRTLTDECGFSRKSIVADIGCGTGILAEMLLRHGNPVYGVEPNKAMRCAAERLLAAYPAFHSVSGTAEDTTLAAESADFITAAQAFHWFDIEKTRAEFQSVLRPDGWVVLLWNDRRTDATPFLTAYEKLLRYHGMDYEVVDHKQIDETTLTEFFGHHAFKQVWFENVQSLDYSGLQGRLLSSSYVPTEGHAKYEPMIEALRAIFDKYQQGGKVTIEYDTRMFFGRFV